ncbi:hypothetical protein HYW74_04175 [Candidatus Pacearchaeota archaeon]|nr:hypothetical protein [Candidatus Pacearchaeota archaeon]
MICIIIITSFLAISFNINELKLKENNFDKVLNINNQLKSNSRIFGDPFISYGLQGLGDQQTFFVAEGHTGNIKSQKINKERLKIWDSGCNNLTKEFYIQFDYFITYKNTNCKSNFLKVFGSINYTDYKGIEIYEISKI